MRQQLPNPLCIDLAKDECFKHVAFLQAPVGRRHKPPVRVAPLNDRLCTRQRKPAPLDNCNVWEDLSVDLSPCENVHVLNLPLQPNTRCSGATFMATKTGEKNPPKKTKETMNSFH